MSETTKVTASFWIIAGVALVWNLFGFLAYYLQVTATPETLAQMYESEAQIAFMASIPAWATAAQAIAVTFGVLGCVLLLARKRLAKALLIVSLAGILVQNVYGFILGNGLDVFGPSALVLPVVVIVVAIALVIFSARAANRGWLN